MSGTTYPTAPGLLSPTVLALMDALAQNQGAGGTPVDLSGYVTTTAFNTALSTKANASALTNYVTSDTLTTALAAVATSSGDVISVSGTDNINIVNTASNLNKIFLVRSTASDTTTRNVYINLAYDEDGNGSILIYNASQTAPLMVYALDQVFLRTGQPTLYEQAGITIPVGKWMYLYRTDANTSGYTVSGGSNPAASYTVTMAV